MDEELGRLTQRVRARAQKAGRPFAIVIAGDHGEGLGDHGESQHGNLLYQSTMHVPLVLVGPGVVARRRGHAGQHTPDLSHRARLGRPERGPTACARRSAEVVLGEAMKPFLEYGWQPQIMAIEGTRKAILAGRIEVYDLAADPAETKDLGAGAGLPPAVTQRASRLSGPVAGGRASQPTPLSADDRRKLASLGYVSAGAAPVVRKDAPRPADMVRLFDAHRTRVGSVRRGAVRGGDPAARRDPRGGSAQSRRVAAAGDCALGARARRSRALEAFRRAAAIAPRSPDVRMYLALHYARSRQDERAEPLLEKIVAESPERVPALEALAAMRRTPAAHRRRARRCAAGSTRFGSRRPPSRSRSASWRWRRRQTMAAIESFETARRAQGAAFMHDLELGVLYLAARRYSEARAALDRVPRSHPEWPMALFKRAQVSVLLNEPDRAGAHRAGADRAPRDRPRRRAFESPAAKQAASAIRSRQV